MTARYTQADALLHISAHAKQAVTNMAHVRDTVPHDVSAAEMADWAVGRLNDLLDVVEAHRAALNIYADDYTTGIPIATTFDAGAGKRRQQVWHPDPCQNRTGPLREVDLPDGTRGTIIASAPGVIDVVRHRP